jgi:L-histidine N-alpha-methyltransferase
VLAAKILQRDLLPLQTLTIDFHPSVRDGALEREAIESLKANRINPKLLYVTPRQAELWRQVFLRHSPIHAKPEFARIYRDAFARIIEGLRPGKVMLVGLGCGTGLKELELYSRLKARGREVLFSAIDVSHDLVVESAQKLVAAGAGHNRSLVCDLAESAFLADWLDRTAENIPRLITFFGLVPNLEPSLVTRLFRSILRPGDLLLVSAHLAPVGGGIELPEAMRSVLPQYANPETLAWLTAALEHGGLRDLVDAPEMKIGEVEGVPAFVSQARWKSSEPFERWGHRFSPKKEEPLRLFHSLRYTPPLFENLLRGEGFGVELLAMTSCREEAIWSVRQPPLSLTAED